MTVSDSEPIPETEPFSRATPDVRGDAMTRKRVAGSNGRFRAREETRRASPRLFAATDLGTETAVVPETQTQDVGVPLFAGTAPFDPDADEEASGKACEEERRRNEREESGAARAAKKDPLASLLSDSDDGELW